MAYDLTVNGIVDFSRFGRVLSQQRISRDPLSGVVDGDNLAFHTNYYPVVTLGSFAVYDGLLSVSGTADYDIGEIVLDSAPAAQPTANYTFCPYTSTQILQFLMSGFDEMETRFTRGWKLDDGVGGLPSESSANIYLYNSSGADPTVGSDGTLFSRSRVNVGFYMLCCEYRLYLSQMGYHATTDYTWRESSRGMTVDKSKMPPNIDLLLERLDKRLKGALEQVEEVLYNGEQYGGFIGNPVTLDYATNFEWQTGSKDSDYRSQLGYHISRRPLTYYP